LLSLVFLWEAECFVLLSAAGPKFKGKNQKEAPFMFYRVPHPLFFRLFICFIEKCTFRNNDKKSFLKKGGEFSSYDPHSAVQSTRGGLGSAANSGNKVALRGLRRCSGKGARRVRSGQPVAFTGVVVVPPFWPTAAAAAIAAVASST
jgi:hypothetical protein